MKKFIYLFIYFVYSFSLWAQTATAPSVGDGTSGNPYQIANLENLYWIAADNTRWDKHFIQTANIDASETSTWFSGAGWLPIGNSTTKFTGTYNGQNFNISDLFISRSGSDYIGLFGYTNACEVKNLILVNVNISGRSNVGALIGASLGSIVKNCCSKGTITGNISNSYYIGGLVGENRDGSIVENCYADVIVSGQYHVGALIGRNLNNGFNTKVIKCYSKGTVNSTGQYVGGLVGDNSGTVENSYSSVQVLSGSNVGGLVGQNWYGNVINSYSTGYVTGSSNIGGLIGATTSSTCSNSFWDTNTSGCIYSAGGTSKTTAQMKTQSTFTDAGWDFNTIWSIGAINNGYPNLLSVTAPYGSGTAVDPYQIASLENLYWITLNNSRLDKDYIQVADIDMAATGQGGSWGTEGWTPIGTAANPFTGTYDGQGYLIENIYINRPATDYVGLFGAMVGTSSTNKAILRNVKIEGVDITGNKRVGALLGKVNDNHHTLIENCYAVNGTVKGTGTTGGLVGANNGTLTGPPASNQTVLRYCFADIDVSYIGTTTGEIKIGGLVGCGQRGTIINCYALGDVNGTNGTNYADRVGGLVGCIDQGSITNSYALGIVTANNTNKGALVGRGAGLGATDGVFNAFYNTANWQSGFNTLGTSKNTTELKTQSTFTSVGWDFDNIWAIDAGKNNGYPYLLVNPPSGNTPVEPDIKAFNVASGD